MIIKKVNLTSHISLQPAPNISSSNHRLPAKLRKQSDCGLLDKLIFSVGAGHLSYEIVAIKFTALLYMLSASAGFASKSALKLLAQLR